MKSLILKVLLFVLLIEPKGYGDESIAGIPVNDLVDFGIEMNDLYNSINKHADCYFSCGRGLKAVPRKGHVPEPNGCGAEGMNVKGKFDFTEQCNEHDICYHTCLNDRKQCDMEFEKAMMKKCRKDHKDQLRDCKKQAMTFSMVADVAGCNAFLDSQDDACSCVYSGRQPFRRHNDL